MHIDSFFAICNLWQVVLGCIFKFEPKYRICFTSFRKNFIIDSVALSQKEYEYRIYPEFAITGPDAIIYVRFPGQINAVQCTCLFPLASTPAAIGSVFF